KHVLSLPALVRLAEAGSHPGRRKIERERRIQRLACWIYRPSKDGKYAHCLERSILLYRFLSLDHAMPQLVIGLRKAGGSVQGHAWVILDGMPFGEIFHSHNEFTPIMMFSPGSRPRALAARSPVLPVE